MDVVVLEGVDAFEVAALGGDVSYMCVSIV